MTHKYERDDRRVTHRGDVGLVRGTVVVTHERVELQRVELEARVVDGLDVLHGVLVHGEESRRLETEDINEITSACED